MQKLEYVALIAFAVLSLTNLPVLAEADNAIQPIGGLPPSDNWQHHSIWDAPPGCYFARDKSGNALWMFYIPGPPYSASSQPSVVFPKDLENMIGSKDYLELLYGPITQEVVKQPPAPQPKPAKPSKTQRLKQHLNAFADGLRVQPGTYSTFSGFIHPSGPTMITPGAFTPMQQPQFMQGTINY